MTTKLFPVGPWRSLLCRIGHYYYKADMSHLLLNHPVDSQVLKCNFPACHLPHEQQQLL